MRRRFMVLRSDRRAIGRASYGKLLDELRAEGLHACRSGSTASCAGSRRIFIA